MRVEGEIAAVGNGIIEDLVTIAVQYETFPTWTALGNRQASVNGSESIVSLIANGIVLATSTTINFRLIATRFLSSTSTTIHAFDRKLTVSETLVN